MTLPTYTKTGNKASAKLTVEPHVFGLEVDNHQLLKTAYRAVLANRRQAGAQTKTRRQVRGGGRKPYQQKHTGQARAGTIRSPLWRGGGVVFGPTGQQNYQIRLTKKSRRLAVRQALSLKKNQINLIDSLVTDGKTKTLKKLLDKLQLNRRILLVDVEFDHRLSRSAANLAQVSLKRVSYLTVVDLLDADNIVLTKAALQYLNERS